MLSDIDNFDAYCRCQHNRPCVTTAIDWVGRGDDVLCYQYIIARYCLLYSWLPSVGDYPFTHEYFIDDVFKIDLERLSAYPGLIGITV